MRPHIADTIRRHAAPLRPQPTGWAPALARLPGIKAVLFDIYGTLVVSSAQSVESVDADAASAAISASLAGAGLASRCHPAVVAARFRDVIRTFHRLARRQGNEHPEVDIREVWGVTLESLIRQGALARARISRKLVTRMAVEYECRTNPVWPMPHAAWCLEMLRAGNIALGLISNAQFFTPELFPALLGAPAEGLGFAPTLQFYSYRYGFAKPGLGMHFAARDALARLGILPQETLCVGNDMLGDVATAAKLGFRAALYAGDRRSLRAVAWGGAAPDLVLTDLDQLPPCVLAGQLAARSAVPWGNAWNLHAEKVAVSG